jgi:hypothetical protein
MQMRLLESVAGCKGKLTMAKEMDDRSRKKGNIHQGRDLLGFGVAACQEVPGNATFRV